MAKPLIATRIDQESYAKIEAIERSSNTPKSDLFRRAVRAYLKNWKPGKIIEPLDIKPNKK